MGRAIILIVLVVLTVYAVFDVIAAPKNRVRFLPKWLWILAAFMSPIGPLLWIFFGQHRPPNPGRRYRRGLGPDDDPDFLRRL